MPSGCQICAATGQCNAAFRNGPGQYCGAFYDVATSDNKPCCCPLQATCKVSPTQCMCHVSDHRTPSYYPPAHHVPQYHYGHGHSPLSPVVPLILILLCVCCCLHCCKRRNEHEQRRLHAESVPVTAVPVSATSCPAENPAYHADYGGTKWVGGGGGGGGGGGAGTAIASGLGGLAAGTFLGDMIGRNAQANAQRGYGGGWFGGGGGAGYGYDTVGDTGGGYDIAGDTGGGGDFAGDSGDGGYDIAGDS